MKLYCDNLVDIIFGEGPLGFRIGESSYGNVIVAGFTEKEDQPPFPLQLSSLIDINYYIISLNSLNVTDFYKDEVKQMIRNGKRPLKVRFAKPLDNESSPISFFKSQSWDASDSFFPVRRYDFSHIPVNAVIYPRSSFSLEECALTPFYEGGDVFECDLRNYVFSGVNDQKTRANCWKMLLKSYPLNPQQWESQRKKNVAMYQEFVNEFVCSINAHCGKSDCSSVPSPIDTSWKRTTDYKVEDESKDNNESKWSRDFGDSDIREIIWKDVERTYSDNPFFHEYNRQVLARILFVFGKLNGGLQYVQGMNELLAPLLYVFAEAEAEGEVDKEVSMEVEADAFFAFTHLMSETRDLFLRQMDSTSSGLEGVLQTLYNCIQHNLPDIANRMNELSIKPHFFAVRWLTTLFAREFDLKETCRVWDCFLADPKRFMFGYCLGAALLWNIEDDLIQCDFAQFIQHLQNYQMPDTETILEKANQIRYQELLMKYEESHPGYALKMQRAGFELQEGASSPGRKAKRITFSFLNHAKKTSNLTSPKSPRSPRSPKIVVHEDIVK